MLLVLLQFMSLHLIELVSGDVHFIMIHFEEVFLGGLVHPVDLNIPRRARVHRHDELTWLEPHADTPLVDDAEQGLSTD